LHQTTELVILSTSKDNISRRQVLLMVAVLLKAYMLAPMSLELYGGVAYSDYFVVMVVSYQQVEPTGASRRAWPIVPRCFLWSRLCDEDTRSRHEAHSRRCLKRSALRFACRGQTGCELKELKAHHLAVVTWGHLAKRAQSPTPVMLIVAYSSGEHTEFRAYLTCAISIAVASGLVH